jgi:hypothetical protein
MGELVPDRGSSTRCLIDTKYALLDRYRETRLSWEQNLKTLQYFMKISYFTLSKTSSFAVQASLKLHDRSVLLCLILLALYKEDGVHHKLCFPTSAQHSFMHICIYGFCSKCRKSGISTARLPFFYCGALLQLLFLLLLLLFTTTIWKAPIDPTKRR